VSVTLSSPMIWSAEVATALSSTQRSNRVALGAQALPRVMLVGGTVVTPTVLGTMTPVGPASVGLSAATLVQVVLRPGCRRASNQALIGSPRSGETADVIAKAHCGDRGQAGVGQAPLQCHTLHGRGGSAECPVRRRCAQREVIPLGGALCVCQVEVVVGISVALAVPPADITGRHQGNPSGVSNRPCSRRMTIR